MAGTANPMLASKERCTGCGACANICPNNAITMTPDSEGFIQPLIDENLCVNCKKCESVCPVLSPKYGNMNIHSCYAMWADDDIREVTSTAGMFRLIAGKTLDEKGVVYGAAWDEDWNVHHIAIENKDELPLITGSKYVQSNVEFTYRDVKKNLNHGRKVLYAGCPCQIAGLYAFLGERLYPELTTVDLICHGVPSPEAFHKYLDDNFKNDEITDIRFRDKSLFGWSSNTTISFKNTDAYQKNQFQDSFLEAYLASLISRKSCENCLFSKIPRQGDLTLGDFWGIDQTDKSWDDKKGTALVLINNRHGQCVWDVLKHSFQRYEELPLEKAVKVNRPIEASFKNHPGRKHFFSAIDLKPFDQLVDDSLNHNYDIGIVGLWYGINYGSILTYFALYSLLRDLGYDPVMLPKPNNLWDEKFNRMDSIAQKFIWQYCNVFLPYDNQFDYIFANDRCRDFVVGSDVVWNYDICGKDVDQFFFLDWVESGHKKIAYAASFGNGLSGEKSYQEKAKYNLRLFDAISVREESSVNLIAKECGREDIEFVLDPVFMCSTNIYEDMAEECNFKNEGHFIFAYLLTRELSTFKMQLLDCTSEILNVKYKICGNPNALDKIKDYYGSGVMPELSVEEWLFYIMNCSYYVGDSYHGLCFSLIFHKPFLIVYSGNSSSSTKQRFDSLLKLVGLEERLLDSPKDIADVKDLIEKEIDWDNVDKVLEAERNKSLIWLKSALAKECRVPKTEDYMHDAYRRNYYDQMAEMNRQKKKIEDLEHTVSNLSAELDYVKRGH